MVNQLEATDELVTQLERVHSVLQFENEIGFEAAVKLVATALELTPGYVELLIELLIEREQFKFVMVADSTGLSRQLLRFTGSRDLDVDLFDLERLDLAAVSKRLANRLASLKIELGEMNAPVKQRAKQERDLTRAVAQLNSARDALARRKTTLASAEGKVILAKDKVAQAEAQVAEATVSLNRRRCALGLPPLSEDN